MTTNQTIERTTDGLALGAVSSPVWLPFLEQASDIAALLAPIAGLVWLLIQIIYHLRTRVIVRTKVESQKED